MILIKTTGHGQVYIRFEVWQANLNPTVGREINKVRPVVIVGEQAATDFLATVTVVPLTSTLRNLPTRPACLFNGVSSKVDFLFYSEHSFFSSVYVLNKSGNVWPIDIPSQKQHHCKT